MSKPTIGLRRAGLASLATTSLVLGAVFAGAGAASADADFDFTRIQGDNRYETSAQIAEQFAADVDTAILASGEPGHYPDALSANFLAGTKDAPVLLTKEDETPAAVSDALADIDAENIIIVGGHLAVSEDQERALQEQGYHVTREAGSNRYRTNAAIIDAGKSNESSDTALIATGLRFPDALAGGPVAFNEGMPIGLANGEEMPGAVIDSLKAANVNKAVILGGELAVPHSVEDDLESHGIEVVNRLEGRSRSATSVAIADYAINQHGFTVEGVNVASGRPAGDGADALSGGPLTGAQNRALLVTDNENRAGTAIDEWLEANANTLTEGIIFGGPLAISQALEEDMESHAREVTTNQSYTVNGQEAATNPASSSTASNEGRREYQVTGLDSSKTYRLELFPSENVTTDNNQQVMFKDANGDNLADDDGNTSARIETINGSATSQTDEQDATPNADGTITFTVDSTQEESVVPVIWLDADTNTAGVATPDQELDLVAPETANNSPKKPAEKFGVGGAKEWFVQATPGDVVGDKNVTKVNKEDNFFNAGGERYFYDANDTFQIDNAGTCENVSQSAFESALSVGDVLDDSSVYGDKGATPSTAQDNSRLCIEDSNPDEPNVVNANRTGDTTVKVDIIDDDTAQDSFNIYRATKAAAGDPNPDFNTPGAQNRDRFTKVGSVDEDGDNTAPEESFTDSGLTPDTRYFYAVTAVHDGDESNTAKQDDTTTLPAGETVLPESVDAYVQNDTDADPGPFEEFGTVNSGDVYRVAFDERLANANGVFRVADNDGSRTDVDCNTSSAAAGQTEAACTLNTADVTIDGKTYGIGEVLTVTVGAVGNVTGDGQLSYPLTVTAASGFNDFDGDGGWAPAGDPDHVIDDEGAKTETGPFA